MSSVAILIIVIILAIAFAIAYYVIAGRYEDEYEYHSIEKFFNTEDEDTHEQ